MTSPPLLLRLSDMSSAPVRWAVPGFIPEGAISVLQGQPGTTKTMLGFDLAARVTTGRPLPAGRPGAPRDVLVLHAEDHPSVLHERFAAARGDADRVHFLGDAAPDFHRVLDLRPDLLLLRRLIEDGDYGLVLVDDLALLLGTSASTDWRTRATLGALSRIAQDTGTPLVAIRHLTKISNRVAMHAGAGRVAIAGSARCVSMVGLAPDDPTVWVWASAKNNLGPTPPSIAYKVEADSRSIRYLGTSDWSAEDLLRTKAPASAPKLTAAKEMLTQLLAHGPVPRSQVGAEATLRGIGWRTVEEARTTLGVQFRQVPEPGSRGPGPSWWFLPETGTENEMATEPVHAFDKFADTNRVRFKPLRSFLESYQDDGE